MASRSRSSCSTPSRSALLMTKQSATSMRPAFMAWISSPSPGTSTTKQVWAQAATSTSSWPTPTVSTSTQSKPAASTARIVSRVRRARSCETDVTASDCWRTNCVSGAYDGSLPTIVMSVPCSVVTSLGTGSPRDARSCFASTALVVCGIA